MYITCHECNTIFRLDERRLKPAGSKVRCTQCGNIFTAFPPAPGSDAEIPAPDAPAPAAMPVISPPGQPGTGFAAETVRQPTQLEGIDLSALHAILEANSGRDAVQSEPHPEAPEGDLDLDFDMDLDGTGEPAPVSGTGAADAVAAFDDLDLEMDFGLDDGLDEPPAVSETAPRDALAEDLAAHARSSAITDARDIGLDLGVLAAAPPADDLLEQNLADDDRELDLAFELEDHLTAAAPPVQQTRSRVPSETPESPSDPPAVLEGGEFDLTDLGDLIDDVDEEPSVPTPDDVELELDLGGEAIESDPVAAFPGDTRELTGDLHKILETLDAPSAEAAEQIEEPDLELDLSGDAPPAGNVKKNTAAEDDFNLDDLTAILEQDDEPVDDRAPRVEDDAIELDSDSAESPEEAAPAEQLDLGDLDDLLATAGPSETGGAPGAAVQASDEELEDLNFELDAEFEDKPIARQQKESEFSQDGTDLDLSDIEEILEGNGPAFVAGSEDASTGLKDLGDLGEFDLDEIEGAIDTDDDGETELEGDEPELDLEIGGQEANSSGEDPLELDLDVMATMGPIDQKTDEKAIEAPVTEQDDLVLELDTDYNASEKQNANFKDDAFDLSDLGDLVEDPQAANIDTIDTGDIELEFKIEEAAEPVITQTSARASRPFNEMAVLETTEQPEPVKKAKGRPRSAQKKGVSKLLLALLLLVMLVGGLFYVIQYNIQIPYISPYIEQYINPYIDPYINPAPIDVEGITKLSTTDINSKFIENEEWGRLFVITGNVRSSYPEARSNIQIQGRLYGTGKVLLKTESVFAGQTFSDQELATTPIPEIKQQLARVPGPQPSTARLAAGDTLPFMVVFSELPDNLDEFAIEPIRSQQAP